MIYQFITATPHRGRKSNGASLVIVIIGHGCGHHEFLHLHPIQLRLPPYLSLVMVFLDGGNSNLFQTFHPEDWGKDSQFDEHIFFKWVGETTNWIKMLPIESMGLVYFPTFTTIYVGNQRIFWIEIAFTACRIFPGLSGSTPRPPASCGAPIKMHRTSHLSQGLSDGGWCFHGQLEFYMGMSGYVLHVLLNTSETIGKDFLKSNSICLLMIGQGILRCGTRILRQDPLIRRCHFF